MRKSSPTRSDSLKKAYAEGRRTSVFGERPPWNKGLKGFGNGESNPFYGKKHREETKRIMSEKAKQRFVNKENHPLYGKQITEEHRQNLVRSHIGKPNPKSGETKKRMFAEGKIRIWSTGLTKYTDYRLKKLSEDRTGDKNPAWHGGIGYEPYPIFFNRAFKHKIRERDQFQCARCTRTQTGGGKALSVHHIDYNKNHTIETNCITLCEKCNSQVNFNREHWQIVFQKKIEVLVGGVE